MTIAMISTSDYVLQNRFRNISRDHFQELELRYVGNEEEVLDSDIAYVSESVFVSALCNAQSTSDYIMYDQVIKNKIIRVKMSKESLSKLFETETYIEENIRRANRRIKDNDRHTAQSLTLRCDEEFYQKMKKESDIIKSELEASFLKDLLSDSGLEDNEHNRLVAEKAWIVTCNTDYHGEYMSESFYFAVEKWFRELKSLGI